MNEPPKHKYPCYHNSKSALFDAPRRAEMRENLLPRLPYFSGGGSYCPFCAYEIGWGDAVRAVREACIDLIPDTKAAVRDHYLKSQIAALSEEDLRRFLADLGTGTDYPPG